MQAPHRGRGAATRPPAGAQRAVWRGAPDAPRSLSGRELLVLQLLALGYSRPQVAEPASLSLAVLEATERSACAALGAATVEEAVELARHHGLNV